MGKKSAPKYDANAAIAAQQSANNAAYKDSAHAAGKTNPFGSSTYSFDANGKPSGVNTTLAKPLNDAANATMGSVAGMSQWLPQSQFKLSDVPSGLDVANATFNQGMTYMQPQFDQQRKALEEQLYRRGIPIGQNDVYRDATGNLSDSQNRAVTDLTMRSLLAAPAEQDRMIRNYLLARNQGVADMGNNIGLLAGLGGLAPQAASIGNQQSVDAMSAYNNQYKSQLDQYNQQQQALQALLKTGVSLATGMPF